ncbi:MAG: hypothetical protein J6N51_00310 [Selenomonas sp.]|nr:hypothetical protein [Selenomonas sp.]
MEKSEILMMLEENTGEKEVREVLPFLSVAQKERIIGFATCLFLLQEKERAGEGYLYH